MSIFRKVKWGRRVSLSFILAMVVVLVAQGSLAFAWSASLLQLSSDPYTNADSQHKTEVEPGSFAFGSTIVSAFQVGRFAGGGSSNIGWATSHDRGRTWKQGFLPGTTKIVNQNNPYDRASDPTTTYDAKYGVWLISWLALLKDAAGTEVGAVVLVSRSTDGGLTWGNPVVVFQTTGTEEPDKDWITCDNTAWSPFYGHCYVEWEDVGNKFLFHMNTSPDGGQTWNTPRTSPDQASVLGGQPLVQPDGTVIVPITVLLNFPNAEIADFISKDGGNTWSNTIPIAPEKFFVEPAHIRSSQFLPSAAIDGFGKVYVVWQDCSFEPNCSANDLVMSTSTDGMHWSPVTRIPIDDIGSGVDHIIPGLGIDKSTAGGWAHLALTYYYLPNASCTVDTCQLNVGFISSMDGGENWHDARQLAGPMKLTWLATTTGGYMVGDYISTVIPFGSDFAVPIFAVAHAPEDNVACNVGVSCDEAMYTVAGGVELEGGTN